MTLSEKTYSFMLIGTVLLAAIAFAGLNYVANDFGLWRHKDSARIWELEKSSKYLLAQRYVPENFDSVLIGPSVSDNLDTRQIMARRVYNLSMAGGNMSEIGAALEQYIAAEDDPGALIVCLYPYMTRDSGMKSFQIHEKEYYGSLFSLLPVTIWVRKIQHALGLMHKGYEQSEAGWHNYNLRYKGKPLEPYIKGLIAETEKLKAMDDPRWPPEKLEKVIDPGAYKRLDALLQAARQKSFRIYAFFYPVNGWALERMEMTGEWPYYQAKMRALFQDSDVLWDMTAPDYHRLRYDREFYMDSHLSAKGAAYVLKDIQDKLDQRK